MFASPDLIAAFHHAAQDPRRPPPPGVSPGGGEWADLPEPLQNSLAESAAAGCWPMVMSGDRRMDAALALYRTWPTSAAWLDAGAILAAVADARMQPPADVLEPALVVLADLPATPANGGDVGALLAVLSARRGRPLVVLSAAAIGEAWGSAGYLLAGHSFAISLDGHKVDRQVRIQCSW